MVRHRPHAPTPSPGLATGRPAHSVIDLRRSANRQCGRIATTASTAERTLRDGLERGRACNAKAAAAVGEVLAMRLKVDDFARQPIYANAEKEVAKKGFKNQTKVWAILNALRSHGVNLRIDDDGGDHRPHV